MPLPKPQSALIFNNYVGDTDDTSKVSSLIDDNDINLFFILADFYYDFSIFSIDEEVSDFDKKMNKIPLENIKKIDKLAPIKIDKMGQVIYETFPQFPESISFTFQGNNTFYNLYNKNFFSIISNTNNTNIDNLDIKIATAVQEAKKFINSSDKIKRVIALHKLFEDNQITNSDKQLSSYRKIISINEKTLAVLDYIFSNTEEDITIPYLFDKKPDNIGIPVQPPNLPP